MWKLFLTQTTVEDINISIVRTDNIQIIRNNTSKEEKRETVGLRVQ